MARLTEAQQRLLSGGSAVPAAGSATQGQPQPGDTRHIQEGPYDLIQQYDEDYGWVTIASSRAPTPSGGGSGGSGRMSVEEQLTLIREQEKLDAAEAERGRGFVAGESRLDRAQRERLEKLARENEQRMRLVSSIHDLYGEMLDIQGRAREMK
ncbi:hypothetical protein LCGC14_1398920, partial [marine sediment metagenome]